MNAKKCDRCGKLYVESSHANLVSKTGIIGFGYVYIQPIGSKQVVDLCQECCKGFEDWFRFDRDGNYAYKE